MTAIHAGWNLLRDQAAGIRKRILPRDVTGFLCGAEFVSKFLIFFVCHGVPAPLVIKIQRYDPCIHRSDVSLVVSDTVAAVSVRREHPSRRAKRHNGVANGITTKGTSCARSAGPGS